MMSSTLVETVSINYEDFNDSFLTCGTCLCIYDSSDHSPKLLPCSHTVCKACLDRINESQVNDTGTIRCPICRESITIPRGGVACFPPSFIVNQLLDLMSNQRRDVIPKCSIHPIQELLFCETCDSVFCTLCTGGEHNRRGASEHTVIPFSIAIKRMSEILLYKAHLCMNNLNIAYDNVDAELYRLETSVERAIESINRSFQDLIAQIDKRRLECLQWIRKIKEEKATILREQLTLIQGEKDKVQRECDGLEYQVEVRNITKRISDLNEKLDTTSTLSEPRENHFIKYEYKHNNSYKDILSALSQFGRVKVSTTFPALCIAKVGHAVTHLKSSVVLFTVDYHGNPRTTGGDPVTAHVRNDKGDLIEHKIRDRNDGTYEILYVPPKAGQYTVSIDIFNRAIKDSPCKVEVTDHNNPVWKFGGRGSKEDHFVQPLRVVHGPDSTVYVLDTGNSRIKVFSDDGQFVRHIYSDSLDKQSGTGLTPTPDGNFIVVNWRTKYVFIIDAEGTITGKFTCADFIEPVDVAVNTRGEIIVADNGASKIFMFNRSGKHLTTFGGKGEKEGQFKLITAIAVGKCDEILVADHRIQIFSKDGKFSRQIPEPDGKKAQYGGLAVDAGGYILGTKTVKGRGFVQVMNASGKVLFCVDSIDDKLKRPSGIVPTPDSHIYVVDLGNDCLKKFRYK